MPNGRTKPKVTNDEIEDLFDRRDDLNLPVFTAGKIAELLSENIEGDSISDERIRQRLRKIDGIDSYKLGQRTVVYARTADPQKVAVKRTEGLTSTYYWPVKRFLEKVAGWVGF